MAYKKIADLSAESTVKIGGVNTKTGVKNPTEIEGYYLGSKVIQTSNGESRVHTFKTPKGNIGVWGTKELNDKLGQVTPGTMTLVEYGGKKNLKGGKTLHTYEVSQDDSNVLEFSAANSDDDETNDGTSEGNFDEEDAAQTAALAAAEKVAKRAQAEAILARGKGKTK